MKSKFRQILLSCKKRSFGLFLFIITCIPVFSFALTCNFIFKPRISEQNRASSKVDKAIENFVEDGLNNLSYEELQLLDRAIKILSPSQNTAFVQAGIILSHRVGIGEAGRDGTVARIGNYTDAQLLRKTRFLSAVGLSISDRRLLVEKGIVGLGQIFGWLKGTRIKSEEPKPKLSLNHEQVHSMAEKIFDSGNDSTIAIDLSKLDVDSKIQIHEKIKDRLATAFKEVIEFSADSTNVPQRDETFFKTLKYRFPKLVGNFDREIDSTVNISHAIEDILEKGNYSEANPLVLYIHDFVPTSEKFEPFSGTLRSWSNDRARKKKFKSLKIIITSGFSISEWGSAQGGFNLGTHINPPITLQ